MTTYETIYPGADDFLVPSYTSIGYQIETKDFGTTLDVRTANQLGELNTKINPGTKVAEVTGVDPSVWESIPEHHLKEMERLTKLTGVSPSVHIPVVEASGIGQDGWNEANRVGAEKQLTSAVLRSHALDPKGNISVTTHSTAQLPEMIPTTGTGKDKKITTFWIVDPRTGKYNVIRPEKRYFPEKGKFEPEKERPFEPEKELEKFNKDMWVNQLSDVNRQANYGEDIVSRLVETKNGMGKQAFNEALKEIQNANIEQIEDPLVKKHTKEIQRVLNHGQIYLRDSYRNMRTLFDMAYENASDEDRKKLDKFAKEVSPHIQEGMENNPEKISQFAEIVEKGLKTLTEISPKMFMPLNDFIIDKSSQTFANVAETAYNKFGKTAPMLNIENPPAGGGLSKAEDLKDLIEESRKKLAENLRKNKGIGKSEAKRISEQMIGATWDVGHINMLRKSGYTEEDIIKQTEIIAPFVKHVHLSDNFGFEHTELPMGMGNVPIKEMMEKLGEKGFEGKKIIEAGNWWQHFSEKGGGNPFKPTIQAFDSPAYAMKAGPSWNTTSGLGTYYSGHGTVNPAIHHSVFQAGFTTLPAELGGPTGGDQSRFSGTPNQ